MQNNSNLLTLKENKPLIGGQSERRVSSSPSYSRQIKKISQIQYFVFLNNFLENLVEQPVDPPDLDNPWLALPFLQAWSTPHHQNFPWISQLAKLEEKVENMEAKAMNGRIREANSNKIFEEIEKKGFTSSQRYCSDVRKWFYLLFCASNWTLYL